MTIMPCNEMDIGRMGGRIAVHGSGIADTADHEGKETDWEQRVEAYDCLVPNELAFVAVLVELPSDGCMACWIREVRRVLRSEQECEPGMLVCTIGKDPAFILPVAQGQPTEAERESALLSELYRLQEKLKDRLDTFGLRLYAGKAVSRPESLQGSWAQAKHARHVAKVCGLTAEVVAYDKLGVYSLLYLIPSGEEREQFIRRYWMPLQLADRKGSGRLAETLEMFFRCNGNVKLTSERLLAHYNTIVYRLERVQAILGVSLDDPEDRLQLQLALKLGRIATASAQI